MCDTARDDCALGPISSGREDWSRCRADAGGRGMTDWGIPDWREDKVHDEAYEHKENWSDWQWRWEFYRRRDDLRTFFDKHADETYRYAMWLHSQTGGRLPLRPNDAGFIAITGLHPTETFGYRGVPNPRISDQPSRCITPVLDPDYVASGSAGFRYVGGHPRTFMGKGPRNAEKGASQVSVAAHEFAVIFDLEQPLEAQIKEAEIKVRTMQKWLWRGQPPDTKHRHKRRFPLYLRVLDAKAAKATLAEISEILPIDMANRTEQAAHNVLKQARALQVSF